MTVTLTSEAIRAMGFRPLAAGESLTAEFSIITVYEARGIVLKPSTPKVATGVINSVPYQISAGAGLNETCTLLVNDQYVDSEDEWKKERDTNGPFVLIYLGPTQPYTIAAGQIKDEEDGSATTFDSFPGLREELSKLESVAMPLLLTALDCTLSDPEHSLALRKLDRVIAGRTPEGRVIHDIRMHFSGTAYVSKPVAPEKVASCLHDATNLAPRLTSKAARFFALGLAENDELKRFLYFFLALEVETHAEFKKIDNAQAVAKLLDPSAILQPSAIALRRRNVDQLRNLFDRFVWCAAFAWPNVTDADVAQFKTLKGGRADIAHGNTSEPPAGYARMAQQLARKVLSR